MGIGASLLVFGLLSILLASIFAQEVYNSYSNTGTTALVLQLVGLALATIGAGLLAYGNGLGSKNPVRQS